MSERPRRTLVHAPRRPAPARVAVLLAALAANAAAAPGPPGRADFEICQACHGVLGQGTQALEAPRIAGLDARYVTRQLAQFRAGTRGGDPADAAGQQMATMARTLADEGAVARVAAYVASLPEAPTAATVSGDPRRGERLFAPCAACHGARGEGGATPGAPRLAGMSDWYLLRQLEAFRAGRRGGDEVGASMRAMALALAGDAAQRDVVAYVARLGRVASAAPQHDGPGTAAVLPQDRPACGG